VDIAGKAVTAVIEAEDAAGRPPWNRQPGHKALDDKC